MGPIDPSAIDFLEWTADNDRRDTKFVTLREDKPAKQTTREST